MTYVDRQLLFEILAVKKLQNLFFPRFRKFKISTKTQGQLNKEVHLAIKFKVIRIRAFI